MRPSEIEMFHQRTPTRFSRTSIRAGIGAVVLMCAAMLAVALPANAATPQGVPLFADGDLGSALAQAVQRLASDSRRIETGPSAIKAACATAPGTTPRLALMARTPARVEIEACSRTAAAEVSVIQIGRQAVALVVPASSPVWSVSAAALFRAIGQNSGARPQPASWSDVDPDYPHLPIGLLLPAPGSRAQRVFDALIMTPGCENASDAHAPFDLKNRTIFCTALRTDIPVLRRQDDASSVATWADSAQSGQIAIVTISELRELDRRVVPLLLDGALPTAANIENGRYPAAEQIQLLVVVPHAADKAQRSTARALAIDLLAEASIGPSGRFAPAGLIPLPPSDRIAARSQAVALLEQP